ncbi:MAG TPA: hypothetical protein VEZ14_14205 [Dehalococcoidia bacterium]|nr:hypothetical protein [Dehalococcoidia bacterium]
MDERPRYWFRARRYGYGWTPNTWQGWVIMAAWAVLFVGLVTASTALASRGAGSIALTIGGAVVLTVALLAICRAKGEPARWRWGK